MDDETERRRIGYRIAQERTALDAPVTKHESHLLEASEMLDSMTTVSANPFLKRALQEFLAFWTPIFPDSILIARGREEAVSKLRQSRSLPPPQWDVDAFRHPWLYEGIVRPLWPESATYDPK